MYVAQHLLHFQFSAQNTVKPADSFCCLLKGFAKCMFQPNSFRQLTC